MHRAGRRGARPGRRPPARVDAADVHGHAADRVRVRTAAARASARSLLFGFRATHRHAAGERGRQEEAASRRVLARCAEDWSGDAPMGNERAPPPPPPSPARPRYPEDFSKTDEGKAKVLELRAAFIATELPKYLGFFQAWIEAAGGDGFLCGPTPTIADCALVPALKYYTLGVADGVPTDCLEVSAVVGGRFVRRDGPCRPRSRGRCGLSEWPRLSLSRTIALPHLTDRPAVSAPDPLSPRLARCLRTRPTASAPGPLSPRSAACGASCAVCLPRGARAPRGTQPSWRTSRGSRRSRRSPRGMKPRRRPRRLPRRPRTTRSELGEGGTSDDRSALLAVFCLAHAAADFFLLKFLRPHRW